MSSPDRAFALPVGTVTFLLTDVEGSTRMWSTEPPELMRAAIARHYQLLCDAVDAHGGVRPEEQGEGDSIVGAFARPSDALRAATAAQLALASEPWPTSTPVRVRMAIHTGEALLRDESNYAGQAIIRTARLRAVGHGGQVLVSHAARDLAVDQAGDEFGLRLLGECRLRDLGRPEQVWQLVHPQLPAEFPPLITADSTPNNLPVSLAPFIGRAREITTLAELVLLERLVIATGSGGAGKTRLAQQVGGELLDQFPAGVWWVELAPIGADAAEAAMRTVFGISDNAAVAFEQAVSRKIDGRPCLLIVDNCEHVAESAGRIVERLLMACPSLHVLATSRVSLDVPGELAWRIPPLALPARDANVPIEALSQFDAVRLFIDRARRARPNFQLTDDNAASVAEICHRLDGIPLAIELAASRCRVMSPERILNGLHDAFHLLAGGSRTLLPRQQTIEASIAWSVELLSESERSLLRRLSVFVDGWTLDAAEFVGAGDGGDALAVLDALDRLVDHSLVHTDESVAGTRFSMLETVRQFAERQLASDPIDERASRDRHAAFFCGWLVGFGFELIGENADALEATISLDRENIVVAATWLARNRSFDEAARLIDALERLWWATGWHSAFARIGAAFGTIADRPPRARLNELIAMHAVAYMRNDFVGQVAVIDEANPLATELGEHDRAGYLEVTRATLNVFMGHDVVDDMMTIAARVVIDADPWWAMRVWASAANAAGFALHRSAHSAATRELAALGLRSQPIENMDAEATGVLAIFDAQPVKAVESLRNVIDTVSFLRAGACAWLAMAAADADLDCDELIERTTKPLWEIEGDSFAAGTLSGAHAMRALVNDDLSNASAFLDQATRQFAEAGISGAFAAARWALIAAGHPRPLMDPATEHMRFGPVEALRACAEEALRCGETKRALDLVHEATDSALHDGNQRAVLFNIEFIVRALAMTDRHLEAARLLGWSRAFRAERGMVDLPCTRRLLEAAASRLSGSLGDDAFEVANAEGRTLTLETAVDYSRRFRSAEVHAVSGWPALTPTELKVAELVATGRTNPEVGKELVMSAETVKTHLSRVFTKLGVKNRQGVVLEASRRTRG